ncbi:MAG: hypothetical protein MO852_03150 [Candidatus Devosia euplotis]|nr:hypothetical protein [Candidatus Devosia euplotis]
MAGIAATCLSLAACTTTQQGAAVGAGAIVGAAAGGTILSTAVGAGVGGVIGAVAGSMIGKRQGYSNQCVYERRDGSRYYDTCPKG